MGESSCGGVAADFGRVVEGVGGGHGGRGGEVGGGRSNAVTNPSGIRFVQSENSRTAVTAGTTKLGKLRTVGLNCWFVKSY